MSHDNNPKYNDPDFYEDRFAVCVSTDGGESYVHYADNLKDEDEARDWYDHHVHQMREAMRDYGADHEVEVLLTNHDEPVEACTLRQVSRVRERLVRTGRPTLAEYIDRHTKGLRRRA